MEVGIAIVNGFLLGVRNFDTTEEVPYNEFQLFIGPICLFIIWDD